MSDDTQTTEQGLEIPIPERDDVLDAFKKAAKIAEPDDDAPEQ